MISQQLKDRWVTILTKRVDSGTIDVWAENKTNTLPEATLSVAMTALLFFSICLTQLPAPRGVLLIGVCTFMKSDDLKDPKG